MSTRMRDANGVIDVADEDVRFYADRGYTVETPEAHFEALKSEAAEPQDRGVFGGINAAATSALSGLTLGGSDVLLGSLATKNERQQIYADREAHPITSGVANVAGAVLPSLVAPTSLLGRAPAGVLSRASMEAFETGKAIGGIRGTAQAIAATGAEGAIQSGGMYLSDVALGDRELTAEGMAGSLGHGFAFGTVAGGALLGVEKGTMAARRMFARTAEGGDKAAQLAATTWERESQAILEANDAAAEIARSKLAELRGIREQAVLVKQQAGVRYAEERALAARGALDAPPVPPRIADDAARAAGLGADDVARAAEGTGVRVADDVDDIAGHPLGAGAAAEEQKLASVLAERDEALSAFTAMHKRIESGEIPGEVGPFTPKGVDLAAERQLAREAGGAPPLGEVAGGKPSPAANAASEPARVEVVRVGRPSAGTFEMRTFRPGSDVPEVRAISRGEMSAALEAETPAGFRPSTLGMHRDLSLETGIPLRSEIKENALYVTRPSKLVDAGISGNELHPEHLASIRDAWSKGERLPPIDIDIAPDGRLFIEDGNHRLMAAAQTDRPVAVRYRATKSGWEPQASARDVTERIRGELPVAAAPARSAPMSLEEQLAATQAKLSEGSTLAEIGRTRTAHPTSPKQLEQAYDDLVERAAQATDAGTKQQLLREADAIEQRLGPRAGNAVDDATSMAEVTTRLEKANADVVEALGDAAPQAARASAKAYRAAEATAERKAMDRTTRAVDDAAEEAAKAPPVPTAKERVAAAKADKLDAEAAFARARTNETEARIGERAARTTAKEARAKAAEQAANAKRAGETVGLPGQPAAAPGKGGMLADMGAVLEAANMVGIPGLPKPSDIPIIGPLLGGYLKFRALKAAAGRFTGRVAVTGESKAAALAAKTKDKIALAVDHSLGLIERNAGRARAPVVAASVRAMDALRRRVFDDGEPDAPKDATLTEVAAVRMREIAHAATNPQAIIAQVRKEMREVYDPDLIAAAEKQRIATINHLNDKAPKAPPPNPFTKREWTPTPGAASQWARRLEVANNPLAAFEALERECLTPEAADTLRAVYPKLFAQAQQRFLERAADVENPIPYKQQLRNSLLFDVTLDPSMESESMQILASAHAKVAPDAAPQPAQPPAPSIAGGGNLTALYQTTSDRRAMR